MKKSFLRLLTSYGFIILSGLILTIIFRISFYFAFNSPENSPSFSGVILSLLHGLRFDLSALIFLNLIFFIMGYFKRLRTNRIFLNVWALVSTIYGFLIIADFVYYSLYSSRLGWDFLAVFNGLNADIFFSMTFQFLVLVPVLVLLFYFYRRLLYKLFLNLSFNLEIKYFPLFLFFLILFSLVGFRGGLQKRVLSPQHAWLFSNGNAFLASMTSNTLHSFLRSKKSSNLPKIFENSKESYLSDWKPKDQKLDSQIGKKPKNILFIFIESWSSFTYESDKLPELKKWVFENQNDIQFFTDFYANGALSKDALMSVYFGLPSYFNLHFFESKYAKNKIQGIGQIAKKKKMDSFFLHAAPAGTQFFDVISKAAGFETYKSIIDNFKGENSLRGTWGVHDEALYQASLNYISNLKKPFLGILFTTSTHTPFKGTPNNNLGTDNNETNYFTAVNYADRALIDFFYKASKFDWFKDTLFVVTGDHSPPLSADWNRNPKELSRIPCLFYWPNSNMKDIKFRSIGRHVDIPKTVFDIMGVYPDEWTPYGQSLIEDSKNDHRVFFTNSNAIHFVSDSKKVLTQPLVDDDNLKFETENLEDRARIKKAYLELKDYAYRLEKNSIYKKK
jgi:phosphoglycerol transferase MdoB-like AlkP superfamily enzyme